VALLPFALLSLISLFRPMLISRGLLLCVPLLLAMIAIGLLRLPSANALRATLAGLLIAGHLGSLAFFRGVPNPNDYREIAEQVKAELTLDDLIFVPPRNWVTTPVFYHLGEQHSRIVADDWFEAASGNTGSRIWLLLFSDQKVPGPMHAALSGHRLTRSMHAHRARALLYVPSGDSASGSP
jgi:hypothetical protein